MTQRCLTNNKQAILKLSKCSLSCCLCGHHAAFMVGQTLMHYMSVATGYTHWHILMFFLPFDFTARLCMLQSAVPFSMTCAFLPPQWVTVSLPLVYGCVIVCLCIVQWHTLLIGAHTQTHIQAETIIQTPRRTPAHTKHMLLLKVLPHIKVCLMLVIKYKFNGVTQRHKCNVNPSLTSYHTHTHTASAQHWQP